MNTHNKKGTSHMIEILGLSNNIEFMAHMIITNRALAEKERQKLNKSKKADSNGKKSKT